MQLNVKNTGWTLCPNVFYLSVKLLSQPINLKIIKILTYNFWQHDRQHIVFSVLRCSSGCRIVGLLYCFCLFTCTNSTDTKSVPCFILICILTLSTSAGLFNLSLLKGNSISQLFVERKCDGGALREIGWLPV